MPYKIIFTEGARIDMQQAYAYYEQQQSGLGERFLSAIDQRMSIIAEHPEYFSFIDDRQVLRDVIINKFPFVIIYALIGTDVRIYSIHPTHKRSPLKG